MKQRHNQDTDNDNELDGRLGHVAERRKDILYTQRQEMSELDQKTQTDLNGLQKETVYMVLADGALACRHLTMTLIR